jgi:adenylate kinase family enzyme
MDSKIIIVGMDNTGKTTLVNQLSEFYNCESIKSLGPGYTRQEMIDEVKRKLELPHRAILERFSILEELVYGKVLRNNSKFNIDDMDWLRDYDFTIIYCRPEDEVIYNFGDREQMKGVIEQRVKLVQEWDELIMNVAKMGFVVIPYDWTKNTLEDITKIIGGNTNE